jgi:DNA-binding NtrC family response regulator
VPLGGVRAQKADVRILAATNRDLILEVRNHRFRQDLFFRLNIVRISLPSLRMREGDIPLLVDHFIFKFNALQGRRINGISEEAMAHLLDYDFPGNVRELENAVEHAFVICGGNVIRLEDLPPHFRGERLEPLSPLADAPDPASTPTRPLHEAEAAAIRDALGRHGHGRTRAARELGISRSTLWRKMKRYGID